MAFTIRCIKTAFNHSIKVVHRAPLVLSCRNYVLKYVDPTKYAINEIKIIEDEDPHAVKIIEKHGKAWHLLDNGRTASLAHTVSGDFNIVKGLSRSFTMHFPETAKLAKKENPLGSVAVLQNKEHFVYYLIIRENWWDRGAYRPMRESLTAMRDHALKHSVENIAMGRLGSLEGGLDFREILKDLKNIFYDTGISLTIYPRRT